MGEGSSKPEVNQPFISQFKKQHSIVQEGYDDPRFGRVNIYKNNSTGGYVAVKKTFSHNQAQVGQCQLRLNQVMQNLTECPYLLKVLGYDQTNDDSMCGSVSEMQTYHEYYLNNLEAEVQQRQNPGISQPANNQVGFQQPVFQQPSFFYSEPELWVILYSAISSVNYLAKYDKYINDIRPQNIYITQNGQLKFVPFELFPEDVPAYLKVQHYRDQCYLPPEQLQEIREKQIKSNQDQHKADLYGIGLTILQCATLESSVDCYDWDNFYIQNDKVELRMQVVSERYSKFFSNMIRLLLDEDPSSRPTALTIAQVLEPYENQILNLIPFYPNYEIIRQHLNMELSPDRSQPQFQSQYISEPQILQQQLQNSGQFISSQQSLPQYQQNQLLGQSQVAQNSQQGQALKFDELPPEVQEQIKRGEKGTVLRQGQTVTTQQEQNQYVQRQEYEEHSNTQQQHTQQFVQINQQQPAQQQQIHQQSQQYPGSTQQVLSTESYTKSHLPQYYQGFHQVNKPPQEIIEQSKNYNQHVQSPQSPIRLVQGPEGQQDYVQQQTIYTTQTTNNPSHVYQETRQQVLNKEYVPREEQQHIQYQQSHYTNSQYHQHDQHNVQPSQYYQEQQQNNSHQNHYHQSSDTRVEYARAPQQQNEQQHSVVADKTSSEQPKQSYNTSSSQYQLQQQYQVQPSYQQEGQKHNFTPYQPPSYAHEMTTQQQPIDQNTDMSEIDRRINEVINKTKSTLQRVEQQSQQQ